MFARSTSTSRVRTAIAIVAVLIAGTIGCSSVGGKGLRMVSEMRSRAHRADAEQAGGSFAMNPPATFPRRKACEQDPFGLMPLEWPDDIPLHPNCRVVYSDRLGSDGFYVVAIVSPKLATGAGVQTFHVDSLSVWESVQVNESAAEGGGQGKVLTIIAERSGAYLKIVSEQPGEGFLASLEDRDYWRANVDPNPLVIRLFFVPHSPSN